MKTERDLKTEMANQGSPWGSLLGLVLLASSLSAILKLYGAFQDQALLTSYGVASWKINWLFVSPLILIITNLIAWLFLWKRRGGYLQLAWLSFGINLLSYWAERLLVWSSDQNLQGNFWFMIILFGAYLALMLLFTLDIRARDRN